MDLLFFSGRIIPGMDRVYRGDLVASSPGRGILGDLVNDFRR